MSGPAPRSERSRPTPHDQLIKTAIEAFFLDFLELVDPNLANRVDPKSLETLNKELFTDLPEGDRREVDLLVRARSLTTRKNPSATTESRIFLIHIEIEGAFRHRSQARMARYYFLLKGRYPSQPVLPIALYLRGGPQGAGSYGWTESVLGFEVCRFRYLAVGLSRDLAERHLERDNPLAWALAPLMQAGRLDRVSRKLLCQRRIAHATLDDARRFLLFNLVETYATLTEAERKRYNKELEEGFDREVLAMQLTWEEKHYYRGRDEGIDKGHREGLIEGTRRTLLRQIEHRLGRLPEAGRRRLEALRDKAALDALATRLLDASSLADLGLDEGE